MAASSPLSADRRAVLDELAREILFNYGTGRRIVGVDGDGDAASAPAHVADDLRDVLAELGAEATRAHLRRNPETGGAAVGVDEFRESTVLPFRALHGHGILVVDGPMLGTPITDMLAWTVWLDGDGPGIGGPGTRTSANAIVDVTDEEHPKRRFSDWCTVPRRG